MKAIVPLLLLSCAASSQPTQQPEPRRAASVDPPPAYHEYPDLPPDSLPPAQPADDTQVCRVLPPPPPAPKNAAARITSGPPVTNHIPPEVIMRPMRSRVACFRRCYDHAPGDAALHGRISVQFVVDRDGYVRKSKVRDSELADLSIGTCVAKEIVGMKFAEPDGAAVTVIYPFVFEP